MWSAFAKQLYLNRGLITKYDYLVRPRLTTTMHPLHGGQNRPLTLNSGAPHPSLTRTANYPASKDKNKCYVTACREDAVVGAKFP